MQRKPVLWFWLLPVAVSAAACGSGEYDADLVEDVEVVGQSLAKPAGTNGDSNYCSNPAALCVQGEGDCDAHTDCAAGLVCGRDNGPKFGQPAGADVCVPASCQNKRLDGTETQIDCGGACGSVCAAPSCTLPNPSLGRCTSDCPCAVGGADCSTNADCQAGLICQQQAGPSYGFSSGYDVCVPATCGNGTRDGNEAGIDCGGSCAPCGPPAVYFTEYTEGAGTTRGLEIYNSTSRSVTCAVRTYLNGATLPSHTYNLATALAPRSLRVVCHTTSDAALLPLCGERSNLITFNGDDAVELVCSGVTVDVIGQIGIDPGTQWGTGLISTADNTLRRNCGARGDRNASNAFTPASEWTGYASQTFSDFGTLPVCP